MPDPVRALVLTGYGLNCELETAAAFEAAGAEVRLLHVADLIERPQQLRDHPIVVFVGGFAFGDHVASGRILANRLRFRMGDWFLRHVDDGGFVLGICNGFQTIAKMGLLPGLDRAPGQDFVSQSVSVVSNDRLGYRDAWVQLVVDPASPCVFTRGFGPAPVEMPARHGEGKVVFADEQVAARLAERHLIPVRYADASGAATERWPQNPNGSPGGVAGLCDETGRIFGLMPHPEAFLYPENHPRWNRWKQGTRRRSEALAAVPAASWPQGEDVQSCPGPRMMKNAVEAVRAR